MSKMTKAASRASTANRKGTSARQRVRATRPPAAPSTDLAHHIIDFDKDLNRESGRGGSRS